MPDRFQSIGKSYCSRLMEVDHFCKLLPFVVFGNRCHGMHLYQPGLIVTGEVSDFVLGLNRWRCIWKDCEFSKTTCGCSFCSRKKIFFMLQSGITDICAEVKPSDGEFHSLGFNNLIG